jgi:hypothetical protein
MRMVTSVIELYQSSGAFDLVRNIYVSFLDREILIQAKRATNLLLVLPCSEQCQNVVISWFIAVGILSE